MSELSAEPVRAAPIDRRRFLRFAAAGTGAWAAAWPFRAAVAKTAADADAAVSVLDAGRVERISWGATPRLVDELRKLGFERWLQAQMKPGRATLPAAMQAQIDGMTLSRVPMADRVRALNDARQAIDKGGSEEEKKSAMEKVRRTLQDATREASGRTLLLALHSPNQLQEQMTWFWMNHFSVSSRKRNIALMVADYEDGLRARSLTRFRDLLEASVFHPAMLSYLDNTNNVAGRINENYARELLELHTMGVDGGYTQPDVQELARLLTGLGIERANGSAPARRRRAQPSAEPWRQGMVVFDPARHEPGERKLLGRPVSATGVDGIREVLDRLASHPATARHVSRRLAQFFVADAPPEALVDAMKARFLASGGDVPAVLQTMFASREFEASLGRKFKDPQHFVVSALRAAYGDTDDVVVNAEPMLGWLNQLGQPPHGRNTPDGWPMTEAAWSGSGQMNLRFEVAHAIGAGARRLFGDDAGAPIGGAPVPRLNNAAWRSVHEPRLSAATRGVLADASGRAADWNALALSSPEFMRR